MDELLHIDGGEVLSADASSGQANLRWQDRLRQMTTAALDGAATLRRKLSRALYRVDSAAAGRKPWGPVAFLAVAGVLGIGLVVSTVYTPSYVVSVDGVTLGTVVEPAVFEGAVDRVEARATAILGQNYTIDRQITYEPALTEKGDISPVSTFENYLFDQIGEVMKSYVLTVDGQVIGAVSDRAELDAMLDAIKAPYMNENTASADFVETVAITHQYTASDNRQDLGHMREILTANTNGETTYTVQKGDTFSAIAYANNMSLDDLKALNPGLDINKLYIDQVLTVREVIPFLSVRTVDTVTYTEPIASPVEEIKDDTMYQGQRKTVTQGVDGEALVTADVTYVNGHERERDVLSTNVLSEPTTTVVHVGTKARPKTMATGSFVWPLRGRLNSNYGYRSIFGSYSFHAGLDIAGSYGAAIKAADGGRVTFAGTGYGSMWSYGKYVVIDHENGLQTIYAHCSSLNVRTGDRVYQGQIIAQVGQTGRATGPHLHFQVKANGTTVSPWNYLP